MQSIESYFSWMFRRKIRHLWISASLLKILLVFSVTPFKIDRHNNQTVQWAKSRVWKKKEGRYAKSLSKIQVTTIFLKEYVRRNVFTQIYWHLYREAILEPILMGSNMAARDQQKHQFWVLLQNLECLSRKSRTLK